MKKILIIDDSCMSNDLMKEMIENLEHGFKVELARNGKEGLEKIRKFLPDLILLDLLMPDERGEQVYKASEEIIKKYNIKVIAISGFGDSENRDSALSIGIDEFLFKPIDEYQLQKALSMQLKIKYYEDKKGA